VEINLTPTSDMNRDNFYFERNLKRQGFSVVAGVDEAGRGPLAGPVVAGAVILSLDDEHSLYLDSKKISPARREILFSRLAQSSARTGVGICTAREIEKINILQASLLAMKRAVENCIADNIHGELDFILVDGKFTIPMSISQQALVRGESKSASIAAASIIAKVTRDRLMSDAHKQYPQYNFLKNQGYPTKEHRQALAEFGPCILHRRTFKGVREYFNLSEN
jgi:ribonuclease HII